MNILIRKQTRLYKKKLEQVVYFAIFIKFVTKPNFRLQPLHYYIWVGTEYNVKTS